MTVLSRGSRSRCGSPAKGLPTVTGAFAGTLAAVVGATLVLVCAPEMAWAHHHGASVSEAFVKNGIVPDVVPVGPKHAVEVDYGGGADLHLGNTLTPTQVKSPPLNVTWPTEASAGAEQSETLYTLAMVDPDAPSRGQPTLRCVKHWLVVNIPGNSVERGEEIAGYRGSGPPKGSGLHRYVFVVYKQPGRLTVEDKRVPSSSREDRYKWSLHDFAVKHKLGDPVAGNFYLAEWDAYVDTIPK